MSAKKSHVLLRLAFAALVALPFGLANKQAAACASEPLIGSLCLFAGNFAPRGWAFANGQLMAISQNTALFSILGTTYGGDGRTTFALPDLRGRAAISAGNSSAGNYALGEKGGTSTTALSVNNLPPHTHSATATVTAADEDGTKTSPNGGYWAIDSRSAIYFQGQPTSPVNMASDAVDVAIGSTGQGNSFNTQSPYLTLNWIIALEGIYPSRN